MRSTFRLVVAGAGVVLMVAAQTAPAAEQRPLVLRHLTTDDGLPQSTVYTTLRDSQGFVWLGTEDGLVRFDGKNLVRYASTRGVKDSLPGNHIWQVVEDAQHDLWIAVNNAGIVRWRRNADRFEIFQHVPGREDSLASNAVRTLLIDGEGKIWIGTTDAGIDILDPATGKVRHLRNDPRVVGSLSSNNVFTLKMDRTGGMWIGTAGGLDRLQGNRITRMGTGANPANLRKEISQVIEASDGTFWVGSYDNGVAHIDAEGNVLRYERHDPRRPDSLVDDKVHALLQDSAGNLWVGTEQGLDLLVDPAAGRFEHYQTDKANLATLRDGYVMSLYQDATGLLWIGTRGGGVSRGSMRSWEMGGARPAWLREQPVMAFADARGGEVWVASLAGLFRYNSETGTATDIDTILRRTNALGDRRVMSLHKDQDGSLWIGTMTNGLKRLLPDNRLQSYNVAPGQPRALSAAGIMSIIESRAGLIWVGTYEGGVNVIDPVTGEIRQLPFKTGAPGAVSGANVTAILEDTQGNLWFGTDGAGLNIANADGDVLRVFHHDPANPQGLPSDTIYSLNMDSDGRVWVATDKGVAHAGDPGIAPASQSFTAVSPAGVQRTSVAYGVIGDPRGGVWISSNAGLIYFNAATGNTRAYHREDGLQGEEFSYGAIQRLRDGRLCFGGPGGFNIFDPSRLSGSHEPPAVVLTGAVVSGEVVTGDAPMWMRAGLKLKYSAKTVSLDFAVLDFAASDHTRFKYRLSSLSDKPTELVPGETPRITLMNLDAGDHLLEVWAASADSPWSATPLRFTLHRAPAPWLTPSAYALYTLLAGVAIALRIRHQRRKFREIERARDMLELQVRERTVELVESNRQLEEAARAKSDFLDRMSHELRTPMNGVVGMTELLTRTTLTATQTHLTKTIRSSAQILLQIVNDLLDLSKIRAGKVALESLPVDLGQVLEECTSLFAGAAETKGLELIVCPPANLTRALRGDPLRVRQVLMNLVGNAVKFTAQGEIVVRADVVQESEKRAMVRLSVADTGIGMDEAVLAKIFEPFTQADEKTTRQFGGTGLGLAICRELAEVMGGKITVESRQQIGSTFCLHLPMELGETLPTEQQLPAGNARLYTRRAALADSLLRHCAAFGVTLSWDRRAQDTAPENGEWLMIDASSQEALLARLLAQPESLRVPLVVIATQTEAERLNLRLLLPERAVVLKPVHHVAVREAIATIMGRPDLVAPAAAPPQQQPELLHGHVLLVEDDAVNAAVAEGYLAELGCSCAWVTSAKAAIARSRSEHFDLIFMDLNMSDMDGFGATARIREGEGDRRVPIVALTAHDAHSYRERVLHAGMDDILSKPYTLQDCHTMVAKWLPRGKPKDDKLAGIDAGVVRALGRLGKGEPNALHKRLAALFETTSQPLMTRLAAALRDHDLEQAANLCHTLKSSAANVGAKAFSETVRELELLCRDNDSAGAATVHQRLAAAYEPLLAGLRASRMAATA